jgi:hypothetical protein
MATKGGKKTTGPTAARPGRAPAALPQMPAWAVPLTYAAITLLLFREVLSGTSLLGLDSLVLSYFARDFYTEFIQGVHRFPYWNPLLFGGLPFVEGMHGDIFYPPSLAMFFLDARAMWGWKMALHVFLAGIFAYLWLRRGLRLERLPAFFGGLLFMMGAELVSLVLPGGDGKLFVSALAPLLFWLTERAVRGGRPADYAIFSLGLALTLFTSHMQAAYFLVWGVSLYFVFRVWQLRREAPATAQVGRRLVMFVLAGLLGAAAAAVQFLPPLEYLREHSHRVDRAERGETGKAWSASYSLNAEEIVALAVPEFVGELTQTSPARAPAGYWGKNPLKLNSEYAGLVPLLLVPVLLLRRRTPQVWFFTGLGVLTLLFALASSTPLFHLFYLIPGVSLFRAWSMIIFLYGLALATLGALAVQALIEWLSADRAEAEQASARRALWIAAGVFGVLALLASAGIVTSVWAGIFGDAIRLDRLQANVPYIQLGFWIAFAISLAVAGAWELAVRGALSARAFVILLALVAAADLYRAGRPFIAQTALMNQFAAGSPLFRPDDAIRELQRRRDGGEVFRVADLGTLLGSTAYEQNDLAVHGIEQLAGHHGNEMGRYRNLIGGEHAGNLLDEQALQAGAQTIQEVLRLRLADITNTAYLLAPGRLGHPALEEVWAGAQTVIYRNPTALPRAYLVGSTEVLPGDDAIRRLLAPDFDPRTTAILGEPLGTAIEAGATGTVQWLERDVDRHTLRVSADRPALLVVLDNYYPAWRATVGGRDVPVVRANHTFRAIPLPAGEHEVVFRYVPITLRTGAFVSLAAMALLLAVALGGTALQRRTARPMTP